MSHNTHDGIRNLSPVSSISLALLFFYFIIVTIGFEFMNKKKVGDNLTKKK